MNTTMTRMLRRVLACGALLATAMAATPTMAAGTPITFVSWGGTTQKAQQEAWAKPFTSKTGVRVLQAGPTNYGKLKAMVSSGNVSWDVVDVEGEFALRAAGMGLLEPLDYSVINRKPLDKRFVTRDSVGSFFFSFILSWNTNKYPNGGPHDWADFFNVERYPGKRMVYKWPTAGMLEMALLADGVTPDDLYPLDVDRALKKLGTIRDHLEFWGSGAEAQQALASGEVAMCACWNGRIFALKQEGAPVADSWNQNLTYADMLVIPKGSPHKQEAMKFLAYAASAEGQARMANRSAYAPINENSVAKLNSDVKSELPTAHADQQVSMSMKYWAEHGPEIAKKWNQFVVQ